jgi:hypothetical protein
MRRDDFGVGILTMRFWTCEGKARRSSRMPPVLGAVANRPHARCAKPPQTAMMIRDKKSGLALTARLGIPTVYLRSKDRQHGSKASGLATLLACTALTFAAPAHADEQTVKLIQLLIQKGILSPGQAKDLLRETGTPSHGHAKTVAPPQAAEEAPPATSGQIRVTYVPQFIRKQIADEVRSQVMDQAQTEGWAAPDALPEWTKRIKIFGDLRVRAEDDGFDSNNYNKFINFNSVNNGSGFDANEYLNGNATNPPFLNTTEDRERFRLRARFGVDAQIDDWVEGIIRVGTGQDDGPVSPNQTLGTAITADGSSGDFSKPALWLDQGYLKFTPLPELTVVAGRAPSQFLPSDLMFYPELQFDGFAAKGSESFGNVTVFGTVGAFPLFNTAFDFSTNSDVKYSSTNSYLTALQGGVAWQVRPNIKATLGVGIFDFLGVQGAVSNPCNEQPGSTATSGIFYCNTDDTRTPYEQFGNTLYAIRNIIPQPEPTGTLPPNPQYYGLASRFNVLDIHPRVDITTYHPIDVAIEGQFIKNLAYNYNEILDHGPSQGPIGPQNNIGSNGHYQGGDTGYMVKATLGDLQIHKLWDWNIFATYRYLETDATLDAIADSDFHYGGTNAQGYILGGSIGIARNTWFQLRYFSAEAISGPHYGTQQVYLDLNSSF